MRELFGSPDQDCYFAEEDGYYFEEENPTSIAELPDREDLPVSNGHSELTPSSSEWITTRDCRQSGPSVSVPHPTLSALTVPGLGYRLQIPGTFFDGNGGVLLRHPFGAKIPARRKNCIRKGDGPDSRPDPASRDRYSYMQGFFYAQLSGKMQKSASKAVFNFCKAVVKAHPPGLSLTNRWVYRRVACAYCWLDENQQRIPQAVVEKCMEELRGMGLLS
jgi:hypothetical protein